MQYLALTIGPIVKTLMEARKTRELWATSYLLSTLMKHLVEALDPKDEETRQHPNILLPRIPTEVQEATLYGAGIYPDRLFMKAEGWTDEKVQKAVDKALGNFAKDLIKKSEQSKDRIEKAVKFWKQYFRIRWILKSLANIENGKLSLDLTPYLENQELEDVFFPQEPQHNEFLELFKTKKEKKNGKEVEMCYLYKTPISENLKGDNLGVYNEILNDSSLFPATNIVASVELYTTAGTAMFNMEKKGNSSSEVGTDEINSHSEKDAEVKTPKYVTEEEDDFYSKLENDLEIKKHLLPRHKYFCLVQADGDRIGKVIQTLNGEDDYIKFSKFLAQFAVSSAKTINQYGGKPVYIGGDDLLFLAPLNNGSKNLLMLIKKLDTDFADQLARLDIKMDQDKRKEVTLSYGINIVYHKFPLFEAIGDAYGLLMTSKNYKNREKKVKNAVTFQLTKHSGSVFKATFSKHKEGFFDTLITTVQNFQNWEKADKPKFVSSLIFKILQLKGLLQNIPVHISKEGGSEDEQMTLLKRHFNALLKAYFNEWDENDKGFSQQRDDVAALLVAAFKEKGSFENDSDNDKTAQPIKKGDQEGLVPWIALYYASMRLLDFMNETIKKDETENNTNTSK